MFLFQEVDPPYFKQTHFEIISSTQDYMMENAAKFFKDPDAKIVITANEQTKGRGTHNRMWASPKDVNIYATFGFLIPDKKLQEIKTTPHLTQIACLSVTQTLCSFGLTPQIIWGNDVMVNRAKISGILSEFKTIDVNCTAGLIGIGLNVNMPKDICASLDQPVTSMKVASGHDFDKEEVFKVLEQYLGKNIKLWFERGFTPLADMINSKMAFMGEVIRLKNEETGKITMGKFIRIDEEGRINLELENGTIQAFVKCRLLREKGIDVDNDGNSLLLDRNRWVLF